LTVDVTHDFMAVTFSLKFNIIGEKLLCEILDFVHISRSLVLIVNIFQLPAVVADKNANSEL